MAITNNKLKGTWIGQYYIHPKPEIYLGNERILTFETFSFSEDGPKYELTDTRKGYFLCYFKKVKSQYNSYEITSIDNDSLVIRNSNDKSNLRTFYRVDDSLKYEKKISLVGKKFFLESSMAKDTIYFKSDSTFYSSSINHKLFWEQLDHSGFKVLFMEGYVPFLIVNQIDNIIELKRFEERFDNYTLTEIK